MPSILPILAVYYSTQNNTNTTVGNHDPMFAIILLIGLVIAGLILLTIFIVEKIKRYQRLKWEEEHLNKKDRAKL